MTIKYRPITVSGPSYLIWHSITGPDETNLPRISSKEPIVGYRVWKLNKETSELMSCYKTTPWPFRKKLIRSADKDFNLGIHAAKEYKALIKETNLDPLRIRMFDSVGLWSDYKADVAGEVYLWGEVKECPYGWLAEFAYPKKLWMPEVTDPVVVMQLEENYGVPVELNPDFGGYKRTALDYIYSTTPPWTPAPLKWALAQSFIRPMTQQEKDSIKNKTLSVTDGTIPPDTQIEIKTDDK